MSGILRERSHCGAESTSCKTADLYEFERRERWGNCKLLQDDDISLDVGQLRIRKKGSAGGHNGIKSIIAHLGTTVFPRIKVGVGEKPKNYDLADYVLGHFSKQERELMEEGYEHASDAVEQIVQGEIEAAMNVFNKKVKA